MVWKTETYIDMLMASNLLEKVDEKAEELLGRGDVRERLAEYLQDICPGVLCINVSIEECVKHERHCGLNFLEIADVVLKRHEGDSLSED